jgi:hypothetical protein
MDENTAPKGMRFSHVYLRQAELLPDSKRMRRRIGSAIGDTFLEGFGDELENELGIPVETRARYSDYWPSFLEEIELRDVLDAITVRYRSMRVAYYDDDGSATRAAKSEFLQTIQRIFAEERVSYRLDGHGGVHFAVDQEFERARASTIAELANPRYNNVRELFKRAVQALDNVPPDGKGAIRSCFFAAEGLFRLMFPNCTQLNAGDMQKHLKPKIDRIYEGQKPAIYVAHKQISGFREWIDAAHFYRHEPGVEEPAQPPLEIAIEMLSQGAAFIRWMARIDVLGSK